MHKKTSHIGPQYVNGTGWWFNRLAKSIWVLKSQLFVNEIALFFQRGKHE